MLDHRIVGASRYASRITREDGAWSELHHRSAPLGELRLRPIVQQHPLVATEARDGMLSRRVVDCAALPAANDHPLGRTPLLYSRDAVVHHASGEGTSDIYTNHDGDELAWVIAGDGRLHSAFGVLTLGAGTFVWIPRGIAHSWERGTGLRRIMVACHGELRVPLRWRNAVGQLVPEAPYSHRDFRGPVWPDPGQQDATAKGPWRVVHRVDGRLHEGMATESPLLSEGWEGAVYPVCIPWECGLIRGHTTATLLENSALSIGTRVVRATASSGPVGDDIVSLVVNGEGVAVLSWTPGSIPSALQGAEGALAVWLSARSPLALTAAGAAASP